VIRGALSRRAEALIEAREPFVAATVIRAQSPTSVRPGDAALIRADGLIDGFVGGACAESSVRLHALRVLETGEPLLLRIVPGDDELDAGAIEGEVTVRNPCLSGGALEIFLEPQVPAPHVLVVGKTPVAVALMELGAALGFAMVGGDERDAPEPGDAAVIAASHGHDEETALESALRAGVPYVGLVASRKRGAAVRAALDVPEELRAQLHTPVGLAIGAQTPTEIALSIFAEIVAESRAGDPRPAATGTSVAVDPVCGMEVPWGEGAITLEHEGRQFYFCCSGCRDAFAVDPAGYAAAG
jgi:xanthine dehydrogenase accessory factor